MRRERLGSRFERADQRSLFVGSRRTPVVVSMHIPCDSDVKPTLEYAIQQLMDNAFVVSVHGVLDCATITCRGMRDHRQRDCELANDCSCLSVRLLNSPSDRARGRQLDAITRPSGVSCASVVSNTSRLLEGEVCEIKSAH